MKPRDHSNVQPWFELARADLAMADLVVASPDSTPEMFGLACFHAQQAAEKALKALVIAEGLPMPRSHDLVLLLDRVTRTGSHEQQLLEALAVLNEYGVGPRYPGTMLAASREIALAARRNAETVWQWVQTAFPPA
jgi:HEPN domain-containing protein